MVALVAPSHRPLSLILNDAELLVVNWWVVLLQVLPANAAFDTVMVHSPATVTLALAWLASTLVELVAVNSHCPEADTLAEPRLLVQLLNCGGAADPDAVTVPATAAFPPIGASTLPLTVLQVTVLPALSVSTREVPLARVADSTVFCGLHCTVAALAETLPNPSAISVTATIPISMRYVPDTVYLLVSRWRMHMPPL